jgi:class 3 adenylate cyclase/putative methionine-R-sulfoxide reductase with GAF domain
MTFLNDQILKRSIGRREEDLFLKNRYRRFKQILQLGQIITSEMNMDRLFELIIAETNRIMETERSSVFLYDGETDELWSLIATGMALHRIRIKADAGIAGAVFQNRTSLIINDAYNDDRFHSDVDKQSGFQTRNILCIPIINRQDECIGVLEILNRISGLFNDDDIALLDAISHYVAIALENSKLYEEIKEYSEELKSTLIHLQTLESIKNHLTKFVPDSVAKLAEKDPDQLTSEKIPKGVTILFIDIQGFSRITEGFEQRLVNDMVEKHFSQYLECIRRHNGEVNETSGDGLMVIFQEGPLEFTAREAVSAGLEIITENKSLNGKLNYPWGEVKLHLGINSGQAYVGSTKMKGFTGERWTYTASGLVTVLAARIGSLSRDSRLLIGPETYEHIKDEVPCDYIGHHEFKNVKELIHVYRAKGS